MVTAMPDSVSNGSDLPNLPPPILHLDRSCEAQRIDARTRAEVQRIEAQTKAESQRIQAQADADAARLQAESSALADRLAVQADLVALEERSAKAGAYDRHPALLRLEELATLRELARNANARLYLDFHGRAQGEEEA